MNRFSVSVRFDERGLLEGSRSSPSETAQAEPQGGNPSNVTDVVFADRWFRLEQSNAHPPVRMHRTRKGLLGLFAAPIVGELREDQAVIGWLEEAPDIPTFARGLNGSFLLFLYDSEGKANGRPVLRILTDRFGGQPFFYRIDRDGVLTGSTSFKALFDAIDKPRLVPEAFFTFFYFRRLFGAQTYEKNSHYLEFATILTFAAGDKAPRLERYWNPDFTPSALTLPDFSAQLADALTGSLKRHQSDAGRFGLLLSGGLDARAILAAADKPLVCFTNCPKRNNEFEVAAELARTAGMAHHFIPRPKQFLNDLVDDSVFLSSGMTIYTEAQFTGYGADITPHVDCVFLGLGLDVLFGGLYMPKRHPTIMGREVCHFHLNPISVDPVDQFIAGVSYRLKSSDPWSVIKPHRIKDLRDALRGTIVEQMDLGRQFGGSGYDLWEFCHLHDLSRHYSFQMARSVQTFAECRIPALDNDLFNLGLQMPLAYKLNWRAYQLAIRRLNPKLAAIRNANHNIRADMPLELATLVRWSRALANRLIGPRFRTMPSVDDRSWPPPRAAIDANPRIRELAEKLPDSEAIDALGLFDMDRIGKATREHISGKRDHHFLVNLLLTMSRFLEK